jgi:hypothetical protein
VMAGIVTAHVGAMGFPVERSYTIGFLVLGAAMLVAIVPALLIPDVRTAGAGRSSLLDADQAALGLVPAADAVRLRSTALRRRPESDASDERRSSTEGLGVSQYIKHAIGSPAPRHHDGPGTGDHVDSME